MNQQHPAHRFWSYIAECIRLLYWIYFKPNTLADYLQEIHPELKPDINPLAKRAEFSNNPRLHRYAEQVWWLTAVTPLLAMLGVALVYHLFGGELFKSFCRGLFYWLAWLIGLMIAYENNRNPKRWFSEFIWISISTFWIWNTTVRFAPHIIRPLLLTLPFLVNLLSIINQFLHIPLGVLFGIVAGMACGVERTLAFGVVGGVAFGGAGHMAWLLEILRAYFWFPQLRWIAERENSSATHTIQ
jgi:hypothetical protein